MSTETQRRIVDAATWRAADADARSNLAVAKFVSDTVQTKDVCLINPDGTPGEAVERGAWFTASTETRDRDRDRLSLDGWRIDNFLRNPVVPWSHNYSMPPVGRARQVIIDRKTRRLRMLKEFAPGEAYPLAETVYQLVKLGYINTCSVGFIPLKYVQDVPQPGEDPERWVGYHVLEQELIESSPVTVPSNPQALVEARSLHRVDVTPIVNWAERLLADYPQRGLWIPKKQLEDVALVAGPQRSFHLVNGQTTIGERVATTSPVASVKTPAPAAPETASAPSIPVLVIEATSASAPAQAPTSDAAQTVTGRAAPETSVVIVGGFAHKRGTARRYVWRTVGDDRVRASHAEREGKVFEYDRSIEEQLGEKGLSIDDTDGHPGEAFNCRCHDEPLHEVAETEEDAAAEERSVNASTARPCADDDGRDELGGVEVEIRAQTYKPPKLVGSAAAHGLALADQFKRGGNDAILARAAKLAARKPLTEGAVYRLASYFETHAEERSAADWANETNPTAEYIGWLLCGGDPCRVWATKIKERLDAAEETRSMPTPNTAPVAALSTPSTEPTPAKAETSTTPTDASRSEPVASPVVVPTAPSGAVGSTKAPGAEEDATLIFAKALALIDEATLELFKLKAEAVGARERILALSKLAALEGALELLGIDDDDEEDDVYATGERTAPAAATKTPEAAPAAPSTISGDATKGAATATTNDPASRQAAGDLTPEQRADMDAWLGQLTRGTAN